MELPLNKFVSPPVDSLLAVKQPLSEIQPKTTETFQDGELGSMHPSLHGTSWHFMASSHVNCSNYFERSPVWDLYVTPHPISAIFCRCSVHRIQAASQTSHISGITACLEVLPSPKLSLSGHGKWASLFCSQNQSLDTFLGPFFIQKSYQRPWGLWYTASIWKGV